MMRGVLLDLLQMLTGRGQIMGTKGMLGRGEMMHERITKG
jgi:hypothetical protein